MRIINTAQNNASDTEKSLEAAKLSVTNVQNSLDQARSKELTGEANVVNQQITLDKLLDQLKKAEITATEGGTITAVNVKEGTYPSGILKNLRWKR